MLFKAVTAKDRNVFYIAPTQKQSRSIIWEALKSRIGNIGEANESRLEMRVPTEDGGHSTIFVAGWENRENFRGMKAHHITFDEVDTMKDFFIGFQEIFRPALIDTAGTADFIGTPKKENPNLRRLEKEATEEWASFRFTTADNPFIPESELKAAKQDMDADTYRQEILAEYVDNAGALFKYTALLDLFTNTVTKGNEKYLIVDIADDGSDKTIFSFWHGLECYRIDQYQLQTQGIIDQIRESAATERIPYSQIAVDAIGVGAGVASSPLLTGIIGYKSSYGALRTEASIVALPNVHYIGTPPLVTDYKNLRSQCVFTLARLVNEHEIAVKVEDQRIKSAIIEELATYQDASRGDGKKMPTEKDDVKAIIGRSPDCFIAGTKVSTPQGDRNIEDIRVGDYVTTPFRTARVTHTIQKTTDRLITIDGLLTGTGNHKIFTGGQFSPMHTFLMREYNYFTNSYSNLFVWKLLSLLSTKARSIGFRGIVDITTIAPTRTGNGHHESHYIDRFGLTRMVKIFLRTITFTTLIVILTITHLVTLLVCWARRTAQDIWLSVGEMIGDLVYHNLPSQLKVQENGALLLRERGGKRSIQNFTSAKRRGWEESRQSSNARIARRNTPLSELVSAPIAALKSITIGLASITRNANVSFVDCLLSSGTLNLPSLARHVVARDCVGIPVYTLTLEQDNVYFANGILVSNCSDTLIMRMYFVIRGKLSPHQSEDVARVSDKIAAQFSLNEARKEKSDTR